MYYDRGSGYRIGKPPKNRRHMHGDTWPTLDTIAMALVEQKFSGRALPPEKNHRWRLAAITPNNNHRVSAEKSVNDTR